MKRKSSVILALGVICTLVAQAQPNLLVNGDFEAGNVGFQTDYLLPPDGTNDPAPGYYVVISNPQLFNGFFSSHGDHTSGSGLMLVADSATTSGKKLWRQTVPVASNSGYKFSFWAANPYSPPPSVQIYINGQKLGDDLALGAQTGVWQKFEVNWNSGSATQAVIELQSALTTFVGNDVVLDDLTFSLASPTVPPAYPAPTGIVSWWKGQNNGVDSVGTNVVSLGGGSSYTNGKVGQSFSFDGVSGYARAEASPSLNVGAGAGFTVEGWIKPTDTGNGHPIIEWNGGAGYNFGVHLWLGHPSLPPGYMFANIVSQSGDWIVIDTAPGVISNAVFQHVALTYDKASGVARLLVNGAVVKESNLGSFTPQTSYPVYIGRRPPGDLNSRLFAGAIDEMSVYNRALGTNEIASIFAAGSAGKSLPPAPATLPSGIVSWWRAESNALDSVAANHGTTAGGVVYVPGEVGQAFKFDGYGDGIQLGNPAGLQLQNFTIETWMKRGSSSVVTLDSGQTTTAFLGYGYGGYGFGMYEDGSLFLTCIGIDNVTVPTAITDTNWHHVAVAKNGTNVVFYVDGQARPALAPYTSTFTFSSDIAIGARGDNLANSFLGQLDELSVYNRPLGSNDIASIYAAGSAGKILPPQPPACVSPGGIVSWWKGEDNGQDSAGSSHGSLTGQTAFGAGKVGQGFVFDNAADGLDLGNPTALHLQNLTLEGWIKRGSTTTVSAGPGSNGNLFGGGYGSYLLLFTSSGAMMFVKLGDVAPPPGPQVLDTQFHHIAVTKNGTKLVYYLDGVAYPAPDITSTFTFTTSIGLGFSPADRNHNFLGTVDEFSVYNRALGSNEVAAIYQVGSVGKCLPAETAPEITQHPVDKAASSGDVVSFMVSAKGTAPLRYQWMFNGTPVIGATNSAVVLDNVQPSNAGGYAAVVANNLGSVTSRIAALSVVVPECTPAPLGMIAWWQAESNAVDSMGSLQGTLVGQVAYGPGKVGRAFVFDGNGDGVSLGNPTSLRLQNFTIETWIKRASASVVTLASAQTTAALFAYGSGGYGLGLYNDGSVFLSRMGSTSTIVPNLVTDTNWHHVAVTKNGTNVVFHVDGVAYVAPAPYTSTFTFSSNVAIGARGDNIGNSFLGRIDELAVYSTPLSSAAVSAIYAARGQGKCQSSLAPAIAMQPASQSAIMGDTVPFGVTASGAQPLSYQWYFGTTPKSGATNSSLVLPNVQTSDAGAYSVIVSNFGGAVTSAVAQLSVVVPQCTPAPNGLVAWWPAEGNALDSASGNAGQFYGGEHYVSGKVGQGFEFQSYTNYVRIPAAPALNVGLGGGFTVEGWVYPRSVTGIHPIWEWNIGVLGGSSIGSHLSVNHQPGGSGELFANIVGTDRVSHAFWSASGILKTNSYQHVALTYDKASGVARILLNGNIVAESNVGSGFTPETSSDVYLGRRPSDYPGEWTYNTWFDGVLDEFSLYNRALTTNEVNAISAARNQGKCQSSLAPAIVMQPASQSAVMGDAVPFSVTASGAQPLSYQWYFGSAPKSGATNANLVLPNVQTFDSGAYSVIVSNRAGVVTSAVAQLSVIVPQCTPAPDGLVTWWKGENNGLDSVGSSHGNLTGQTTFGAGKVGQGFVFDNAADGLDLGNPTALQLQNLTLEGWIKRGSATTVSAGPGSNGNLFGGGYGSYLLLFNSSGAMTFVKLGDVAPPPGPQVLDTQFHHIAVTKNGTKLVYYLDGVAYPAPDITSTFTFTTSMGLGFSPADRNHNFLGTVDEFSVYNRALGSNEIAAIYAARGAGRCPLAPTITQHPVGKSVFVGDEVDFSVTATGFGSLEYQWSVAGAILPGATNATLSLANVQMTDAGDYSVRVFNVGGSVTSSIATLTVSIPQCTSAPNGLVAWWQANESVLDSVGTNLLSLNGGGGFTNGKVGQSFGFDGVSGFARAEASPSLDVGVGAGFTVEGWINPNDAANGHPIIEWNGGSGYDFGVHLWVGHPNRPPGYMYANLVSQDGNWTVIDTAPGVISSGVFQHVALTYDKASGMARLLVNGAVVKEVNLGSFTPQTSYPVYIGRRPPGDLNSRLFAGAIDELSIYNRALATNEIAAIYAARGAGKCPLPPTILAITPPSALVNEGANVAFTAMTAGSPPLTYQWQFSGGDLAGATNATLSLNGVMFAQAGTYTAVVSGPGGVASSNVVLAINRAPLADAGATEKLLISPNGSNAVAILDGSLSSDPDGDVLTYAWFHAGASNAFATGVVGITSLPLGTNALTLLVNDGMATDDQDFVVEVITTSQAVDRLVQLVEEGVERPQPLIASLRAALASIDRSQPAVAINQLEAFKNKVLAQVMPVDPELAAQLLADAQAIINTLNGGTVEEVALEITSITEGKHGRPKLGIRGNNQRTHVVEMSTNLVDWAPIGVAQKCGDCAFDFEDEQSQTLGARYYRVVSPK